jgi:hypothetical protein
MDERFLFVFSGINKLIEKFSGALESDDDAN